MNGLFSFLASSIGRAARVVAGIILILIGLIWVQGAFGWILVIVGLVPLLAGVLDKCVFAPLFGLPFAGPSLRRVLDEQCRS